MKKTVALSILFAVIALAMVAAPVFAGGVIPVTGSPAAAKPVALTGDVAKVSVEAVFDYGVVQQPKNNPAFVSEEKGKLTQFRMAAQYGSLGLLAHNYLAGAPFEKLKVGDIVNVTYTDGSVRQFKVESILRYQALTPNSPYSKFVDLQTNKTVTTNDVFAATYGVKDRLVLQTCIEKNKEPSWGRLFIIATPYSPIFSD